MDREALVERNRRLASAFHRVSFKQRVRRAALVDLGRLPIPALRDPPDRILLIRPDHLGDVLLTTPALKALRAALPRVELHALVGPWSADVLSAYDEVDTVLTLPFPGFSRSQTTAESPYVMLWKAAQILRQVGYRSAIIFRPDHWWGAMLAKFAGIPQRIGYALPDTLPFLTDKIAHTYQHAVLQSLKLVEPLTGTLKADDASFSFPVDALDRVYVDSYLEGWEIAPSKPMIAIHPGSGTWVKRWNEERWAKVADTLADEHAAAVVITGSDSELGLARRIAAAMTNKPCFMVGDTRVSQLAALYARAKLVMGPDSGPLHLAAAVGTPTVTLFGPADPVEFGPWGSRETHRILASPIGCRPCRVLDWMGDDPQNHPCMGDIDIGQVLDAARRAVHGDVE